MNSHSNLKIVATKPSISQIKSLELNKRHAVPLLHVYKKKLKTITLTTSLLSSQNFHEIISRHWPVISTNKRLRNVFPEHPLIAYKRPPSLKDTLVITSVSPTPKPNTDGEEGCKPCHKSRCKNCAHMQTTNAFTRQIIPHHASRHLHHHQCCICYPVFFV